MSSGSFSTLSNITAIIADLMYPLISISFGLFMLFTPREKYEKIFPVSISEKALKIGGVFLIICGIIFGILWVINFLNM